MSRPRKSSSRNTPTSSCRPARTRNTARSPTKSTTSKGEISKIEDREIELMEQAEAAQKEVARATQEAAAAKKLVDSRSPTGPARGQFENGTCRIANWTRRAGVSGGRNGAGALRAAVEEQGRQCRRGRGSWRLRRLPHEIARANPRHLPGTQGIVSCINCGRILYYTRGMALAAAD